MNNTYVRKHFLQAGIAVMLCIILMIPSFQALAITKETNYTKNESLLSVTEESQSFTFTLQVPSIDISDVTDDDGRTYQKISIPGLDSFFPEDAGGPLIPYLIKYVHIPDNAKDVTVQVQTDGAPSVYRDILVYPCPKSIEKTDDGGNKYLAEEFCFDETKYASQHSAPENLVEIVEVGYLRSVRIGKLRINPVTYDPALKTIKVVHNLDITVQWEKDKDIQTKPDKTEGFEQLMTQSILNYEPPVNTPQKTRSSERGGSVRYITGSQLWDTSIVCDYLVITHQDFFSSPVLADFVNYRATYGNLDVVVVQTSDIGSDYSIKYFVKYAYDYWQTAPQYLLIVGNKQHVPSHQTSDSDGFMDDEKWYVCVAGGDEWADMAMGRFSVENEAELQSIYNKIVYYEQHQLSDKPFFKKALVFQAFCQYAGPVYNTVFNAGFTTTYLNMFYGNYSQDIIDAINSGQDIVYYSGHGSSTSWEIFSIGSLPYLTNTIFPIVMTTACSTADLDAESLGEQFVNIENKGAVAYYGATKAVGQSPTNEILGKIFDNAEYHLGKAIMYGEFMYDTGSRHKIYILLGDPALQSFGYPEDSNNLPDLTVSSSGVNYDCFTQQLTVNVSNIGAVDAYNVLVNVVIVDENAGTNILLGSHVFSVVPAGGEIQSVTLSDIAPPVNGDYSVAVIVDPENAIEESFELNNYNGRRMMISPTFIDATSSSGISGYSKLVVPCDINKDGYPDVYLTGRPTPTTYGFLYLNNGNGTFTDITTAADVQCANVSGAVFGDVDNDGNTDLYISSGNGDHLFHNQGDETFTDITGVSGVSDVSSDEAIFGDVDNDGDLDLLVMKHQPPRTILFMNNGDGTFTNETNAHGLNALNSGEYVNCPRFVDLDNDGDLDLLVDHSSFLIMYQNDGSGFFTPTTLSTLYRIDPPWFLPSFSVSDIDNDGDLDIIVRDYESKITFLLQNDDHSFTVRTDLIFGRLLMYYPPFLFAEIDNNPGEDLLSVRGNWGEPSQAILIRNSKTGLFKNYEYLPVNRDCSSLIPCVLDIDRDGDNDIIYGNYLYLEPLIKVLKNQVNDQNWLDVQPVGRICNRDAIGTKVYIYSSQNELIGFQEVSSQRPVPLHFGLGGTEGPYDVVIQWPASEITDVLQQVSPAQLMTVTEGSTLSSLFVNAGRPYVAILGDPIHFRGVALGEEPYTWHWDFGDNSISDSQNPYHNYTQTGVYTVTLTVTDSLGMIANDTTTATITPLIADAHGPYTGTTGQSISFTGTVTGGKRPYTWLWDFGDGRNSTEQNTTHIYSSPGTYPITLTATDALGHSNSTRTTAVIYLPPVHNINNDGYYYTIQAAINDAYPGDTICVRNGTYYESIYISKPLTLIGENKETTIIDDSHAFGFSLAVVGLYSSSDIVIHQFTIKMNKSNTVIRLHNTNHATISDCIITTDATGSGIFFYESPNNIISQNLITHCDYGISLSDGSSQNNIYENTIQDNRITGIIIQGSAGTTINNRLYHNNFINNTQNAYDECNNIWYNPDLKEGNFWDDYTGMDTDFNGIGDTPYNISGGSNKDYYPLICPWPQIPGDLDHDDDIDEDDYQLFLSAFGHSIGDPEFNPEADYDHDGIVTLVDYQIWLMYYRTSHTDILISGITANYITGDSTSLSAEHDTATKIKLTATIKNNGTIDITTPFQVSFYGYRGPYDPHIRPIHLGTIEIPSLSVGETTEAILLWRLQPEIQTILAIADSSRVVKENNENNNEMSIKLPSYPLWKCLTETQEIYKKLNEQYKVPSAEKIITLAEEAISLDVYANPQEYLEAMKGIAGVEFQVGDELKGQVHDDLLEKYQEMVKQLLDRIVSSSETSWDDAAAVAELQVQICKHMKQMMT